ncbi:MAG: hypothetical protein U1E25_08175 [Methylocystis sp.]
MDRLDHKIAPFAFWLCFLALGFVTSFDGRGLSARAVSRDRPGPAKPLCQEGPRGASGLFNWRSSKAGSPSPSTAHAPIQSPA